MTQTLLMALWTDRTPFPESESVIVNTDPPDVIVLELDDGRRLAFDAVELRTAIGLEARKAA